jgi:hypothetical protein
MEKSMSMRQFETRIQVTNRPEQVNRGVPQDHLVASHGRMKITYKDPNQLRPRARNPHTHTAKQIKQIAASIKEFVFISPILIDGADGIIAGHGRAEAAFGQ